MRCKSHIFILMPRNSHSIFNSSCIDIEQCTLHVWTLTPGGVLQSQISWKSENPTFEEILSLPTSNLSDVTHPQDLVASILIESAKIFNEKQILKISSRTPGFTHQYLSLYALRWLLHFIEERPIPNTGYYRESIELSWLHGRIIAYGRHLCQSKSRDGSMWSTRGCNNMEIETQESYHPRRHQNNFAQ